MRFFGLGLLSIAMTCCTNNDEISLSYRASKEEAKSVLENLIGQNVSPQEITIKYNEVGERCINLIRYSVNGKIYDNLALIKGTGKVKIGSRWMNLDDDGGRIRIRCLGTCDDGTGGCRMEGRGSTVECSCEGCVMEVVQSD